MTSDIEGSAEFEMLVNAPLKEDLADADTENAASTSSNPENMNATSTSQDQDVLNESSILDMLDEKFTKLEQKMTIGLESLESKLDMLLKESRKEKEENVQFRHEVRTFFTNNAKRAFKDDLVFENVLELPCHSAEHVVALEACIKRDPESANELRRRWLDFAHNDLSVFIRRALHTVWTNNVAQDFSWKGKANNISIENYSIIALLKKVATSRYDLQPKHYHEFEKIIQKWFFYSGQRAKYEESREEQNINGKASISPASAKSAVPSKSHISTAAVKPKASPTPRVAAINNRNSIKLEEYNIKNEIDKSTEAEYLDESESDEEFDYVIQDEAAADKRHKIDPAEKKKADEALKRLSAANKKPAGTVKRISIAASVKPNVEANAVLNKIVASGKISIKRSGTPDSSVPFVPLKKVTANTGRSSAGNEPDASSFPIKSTEQLHQIENWLLDEGRRRKITHLLKAMKTVNSNLNVIFPKVFTDDFLKGYSWNGKNDHKSLENLEIGQLILKCFKDPKCTVADFEKSIRVCIFRAHTRNAKK